MYDPTIGRFLSEDPIGFDGGDPNLYRYVGNSPPNGTDPTGLRTVKPTDYLPALAPLPSFQVDVGPSFYRQSILDPPSLGSSYSASVTKPFGPLGTGVGQPSTALVKSAAVDLALEQINRISNPASAPRPLPVRPLTTSELTGPLRPAQNSFNYQLPLSVSELMNGISDRELDESIAQRIRAQEINQRNAAERGAIRSVTQAEYEVSRYNYLSTQAIHTPDERKFMSRYEAKALANDPYAQFEIVVNALAGFAGGYSPPGTPLSARQPVVPVRGPNASNPPRVQGNSFEYVGETHVYAIRGSAGTHKIGESMQGVRKTDGASIRGEAQARALRKETGQFYYSEVRQTFQDKQSAAEYQTRFIETFRKLYGQDALPGNKTNR